MAISPASASVWAYPLAGASPYAPAAPDRARAAVSEEAQMEGVRAAAGSAAPDRVSADGAKLSEAEVRELQQLQQRDREVRAHEMAHVAAGAGLVTRGASYTYQTGPDGQRYAIGGEVSIDTSPGRTPEETLGKAEQVRAAALAPADPSPQDRQVASKATRMAMDARMEIARQAFERGDGGGLATSDGTDNRSREGAGGTAAAPASAYVARQARSAYEMAAASAVAARPPSLDVVA